MSLRNLNLAIVDLETTGGNVEKDKIIEIGILKIKKGKLVEQYSSLVNPQRPLPEIVSALTGLTESDLKKAPSFTDISSEVNELLRDSVFVAHNVSFDYGFMQSEFGRFQQEFNQSRLCTVKLSRTLYPGFRRHNLDCLIDRFNLTCKSRHRALDDAQAVWNFLRRVEIDFSPGYLSQTLNTLIQIPAQSVGVPAPR
jgi:DNA polymerase III subunit epsilon